MTKKEKAIKIIKNMQAFKHAYSVYWLGTKDIKKLEFEEWLYEKPRQISFIDYELNAYLKLKKFIFN